VAAIAPGALDRWADYAWPLLQATLGAAAAWWIALHVAGHPDPFFAPMAAVIALNAPRGERGLQAVRLLSGVVLGIVLGEVAAILIGRPYVAIALATFVAMSIARAAGGARIVVNQAGVSAILAVAAAAGEVGVHRLIDALIGGGVALVISQLLFPPEPVAMLRRAEADALRGVADGLALTARALETGDADQAARALRTLRQLRDRLAELARLRKVSGNVVRHTVLWRSQRTPLVREREDADQLDLLAGACIMLARAASAPDLTRRGELASGVRELADVLATLARTLGDRDARQTAADRALAVARHAAAIDAPADSSTAVAAAMLRLAAADVMIFAGVDASQAAAAIRAGAGTYEVPSPPATPRAPFHLYRWRGRRRPPGSPRKPPRRETKRPDDDPEE
jgi:uncharacterized membrane protein YgaE (UPF0421/DUF939 family)